MRFHIGRQVSPRWTALCLALAFVASCNRTHRTTVAVIPKATGDLFWESVHAGAVKAGRDHKIDIIWDGPPAETDIAGEMKIVETMINRQVDAIVLAPSDRSAFKIVVNRARAAGIPVVIYDSGLETQNYTSFVATDNFLGGSMAADRMGQLLNGKGKVVMIKTVPGGASTTAREDGFRSELNKKFPGIKILDERFGMANPAVSRGVTENMLTAHPELDGIFASNESGSAGASQALKNYKGRIKLVGFDSSPMLIDQLKAGVITSLVIQDPFRMGETAVGQAVKAIGKQSVQKDLFLSPRLVDLKNLNDPEVQAQIKPDLERYLTGS